MNRWVKSLLVTGISFLLCLILFSLLSNFNIDNKMHENLNMLALVLSISISLITVNTISKKREKNIKDNSEKIKQIEELNKNFKKIICKKRDIIQREYSRKSLDRVNVMISLNIILKIILKGLEQILKIQYTIYLYLMSMRRM